jgi:hypothetical protein
MENQYFLGSAYAWYGDQVILMETLLVGFCFELFVIGNISLAFSK